MKTCEKIYEGVPRLDKLPDGWRYIKGISSPNGWRWANNGKSRFSKKKEYRHALIRDDRFDDINGDK